MIVEAVVLHRDEGILQVLRNLRDLNWFPVLIRMDIGDLVAVDVIDMRRGRRQDVMRQIRFRIHAGRQESTADAEQHHQQDNQKSERDPFAAASAGIFRCMRPALRIGTFLHELPP